MSSATLGWLRCAVLGFDRDEGWIGRYRFIIGLMGVKWAWLTHLHMHGSCACSKPISHSSQ